MLTGFKTFLLRANVVDLAVGDDGDVRPRWFSQINQ